jgi:hypothetical protein
MLGRAHVESAAVALARGRVGALERGGVVGRLASPAARQATQVQLQLEAALVQLHGLSGPVAAEKARQLVAARYLAGQRAARDAVAPCRVDGGLCAWRYRKAATLGVSARAQTLHAREIPSSRWRL